MDAQLFMDLLPTIDEYLLDIYTSASIGCDERVRDIIENSECKSIIDSQNVRGWTPLMYAACCANLKVVLLLLEEGARTDIKNHDGHSPLILAAKCGSSDVVNLLIDNGAKVNDRDLKGWTALFHAASFGHRRVVQSLVERGAIVDIVDEEDRITPLMLAAAAGHEMIIRDLLQLGTNASIECKSGDTARSLAAKNGHINVKNILDVHLQSKQKNYSQTVRNPDLASFLKELDLLKYFHIFENNGIDLNTFWLLNDNDLQELGIQLLGPRKKICLAISKYHQEHTQKSNVKEPVNVDNLLLENRKLNQLTDKLKGMVLYEKKLRLAGEKSMADKIQSLKNYSDAFYSTLGQMIGVSVKIKENHDYLSSLLCSTFEEINIISTTMKPKVDCIFETLDCMKKLLEFQHQKMVSLQQADF